jgi:hypothetical protein
MEQAGLSGDTYNLCLVRIQTVLSFQFLQTNDGIVSQIRTRPVPTRSFHIHHSLIVLPFDV